MDKLKNKNGSVLSTAIIVLLVVTSLTTGMYMIANMYLRNTMNNTYHRQAYLYAKSECTSLANYLIKYQENNSNKYYVAQKNDQITFDCQKTKLQNKDGKVANVTFTEIIIKRTDDNEIIYKVTAKVNNQSSTVKLICKKNSNQWVIGQYS